METPLSWEKFITRWGWRLEKFSLDMGAWLMNWQILMCGMLGNPFLGVEMRKKLLQLATCEVGGMYWSTQLIGAFESRHVISGSAIDCRLNMVIKTQALYQAQVCKGF